nr:putative late embryogenesis abundant domain-containing protein / LEA domain-containing protein [Tanacetum cinerariifolium]
MMNVLAIGLVLTSLVTAGIWSPSSPPVHQDDHREVIVKEGHRVVVVEYDKEADGSTKVLISPHEVANDDDVEEKRAEEGGQGGMFSGPRELVCDAYGKCKHKIASVIGKTKDKVVETEEHAKEVASEAVGKAKETASEAVGKAKETASEAVGKAKETASEAVGKAKETASGAVGKAKETVHEYEERAKDAVDRGDAKEKATERVTGHTIGDSLGKAKDSVAHGIDKAKKVAEDVVGTVKDGASKAKNFDVVDSPKRMGEDIQRNVTGKIEESAEHVKEQAKETVHNVQQAGQKSLHEILSKLREVISDVFWYMASRDKVDAVVGLIHMLGFSTAYGMCVWVTFVSSYILGRYLPRQQFAMVQSRIYPVYFKAMAYCVSAVLLGHLARKRNAITYSLMEMFQGLSLLSALMMVLTNMIVFEPKATKLMYERMKIEKEEGRGVTVAARDGLVGDNGGATAVRQTTTVVADRQDVLRLTEKLKRLNTYSSALNVSTLVLLTWHMAYMGQKLQATR